MADVFTLLDGFVLKKLPGRLQQKSVLNGKVSLDEAESLMLGIQAQNKNDLILEKFRSGDLGQKILNLLIGWKAYWLH